MSKTALLDILAQIAEDAEHPTNADNLLVSLLETAWPTVNAQIN